MKRGEVWTAAGGADYSGKPRPVVIVQDDRFDTGDSVTVCPLTIDPTPGPLVRLAVAPAEANGLRVASWLMVDKLATIPRRKLGRRIGRLDDETMVKLNRAMLVFLGMAGDARKLTPTIGRSSAPSEKPMALMKALLRNSEKPGSP